jgi:hypothetical protein
VALRLQDVGREQTRGGEVRPQVQRKPQQQHGKVAGVLRAQRARQSKIRFGNAVGRRRHGRCRDGWQQGRESDADLR